MFYIEVYLTNIIMVQFFEFITFFFNINLNIKIIKIKIIIL